MRVENGFDDHAKDKTLQVSRRLPASTTAARPPSSPSAARFKDKLSLRINFSEMCQLAPSNGHALTRGYDNYRAGG